MMITGTLTDQSPGQQGTPAVSDGDQAAWMAYLHMQKPMPSATGVPVTLTAIAADGSSTEIGKVTSDGSGMFKKSWTPTTEGEYTIVASFSGTEAYGGSHAVTAVVVTAGETQTTAGTSLDIYIIAATIVILIAIALATVVLRKK